MRMWDVRRWSYLCNHNPCTSKTASVYWNRQRWPDVLLMIMWFYESDKLNLILMKKMGDYEICTRFDCVHFSIEFQISSLMISVSPCLIMKCCEPWLWMELIQNPWVNKLGKLIFTLQMEIKHIIWRIFLCCDWNFTSSCSVGFC